MENMKLLHPSTDVLLVDGKDKEALEIAMHILHDIGWLTQQCGIDAAVSRIQYLHEQFPDLFISGCAHGAACLHDLLAQTSAVP